MPTEQKAPLALFLFAHQDDEFGVFHQIGRERAAGRDLRCLFITDGGATADPALRDAESRRVLTALSVRADEMAFLGRELGIPDGAMDRHVASYIDFLCGFLEAHPEIVVCYVPAWEGGHPDHDVMHAATLVTFARLRPQVPVLQYPLYNGRGLSGPWFRVLSPLPENGPVLGHPLTVGDRLRYLRLCLSYPSQWKTWMGLLPFVGLSYLTRPVQQLQETSIDRVRQRPHEGPLYYERRKFSDWPAISRAIDRLFEG